MAQISAKILSLNVSHPKEMAWQGKTIISSMLKNPVPGPLVVSLTQIEGDSFNQPEYHGTVDSVLYAYGVKSAMMFMKLLGRDNFVPGSLGENLTVDELDETLISVGDVFQVGEVTIQATYPRIPCGKVNIRMEHPRGQKLMQESGRSGIYFRILKPGRIFATDKLARTKKSEKPFLISDVYKYSTTKTWTKSEIQRALDNGGLPARIITKFKQDLSFL